VHPKLFGSLGVRRTGHGCPTAGEGTAGPRASSQPGTATSRAIDGGTEETGAAGGGGGGQRRQRGRTRGRSPRAADDTKMPSASFSSSRSYVRRSRRKNGNRIPLPRTGKRESASERASATERERASEEGRTEGKRARARRRDGDKDGFPIGVGGSGTSSASFAAPLGPGRRRDRVGIPGGGGGGARTSATTPPGSAISIMPLFPGLRMHAPRVSCSPSLRYPPISPRLLFPGPASLHPPILVLRFPSVSLENLALALGTDRIWKGAKRGDLKLPVSGEKREKGRFEKLCT